MSEESNREADSKAGKHGVNGGPKGGAGGERPLTLDQLLDSVSNDERAFFYRHIGPRREEIAQMLASLGVKSLEDLVGKTIPAEIRTGKRLDLEEPLREDEVLGVLSGLAAKNQIFRNFIGQGFYDSITPGVIERAILQNPGWYTQYTPYQAEISQGRLEALINFQTMIVDLTGLPVANASLLDEGTAAAEAMALAHRTNGNDSKNTFFVDQGCHPHVIDVVKTRGEALGFDLVFGNPGTADFDDKYFGCLVQYPTTEGAVVDFSAVAEKIHRAGGLLAVDADLLALTILKSPGELGADMALGNTQRFGVPLFFGGPHAAYLSVRDEFSRQIPGRIVGVSKDSNGKPAYRLSLQTREQHIRRERATSNICTAQVLLAVIAGMYAAYHGPAGLKGIGQRVHNLTVVLRNGLKKLAEQKGPGQNAVDLKIRHEQFFDTLVVELSPAAAAAVKARSRDARINLRWFDQVTAGISLDQTADEGDVLQILQLFDTGADEKVFAAAAGSAKEAIAKSLLRTDSILQHPNFNSYHSETEMLRYIKRLESRDLSLCTAMIPLGSCTMKLNAVTEMAAVSFPGFAKLHPFAPIEQAEGYQTLIADLEEMLSEITGLSGTSVQPNAGSQGEYAGLLIIREFHRDNGAAERNVCLIPQSAHGTNPASAALAGMKIVVVSCDESGNIDTADLRKKAEEHKKTLSALMMTYPSTHGVFEEGVKSICEIIHSCGGQVYMDGANLNAQVGLCRPGDFGVDVLHINLHKTFCIPHGGGGPGVGPVCVAKHLVPYLPGHSHVAVGGKKAIGPVSSTPWGSAGILVIPWAYIKMMGSTGLPLATAIAILNANYIAKRIGSSFPTLYSGKSGFVAHECILDLRRWKKSCGLDVTDVAKRLMDYGFHAPTVSFPVVETLMVEPTESESKAELDRFCDSMIKIRREMDQVESGSVAVEDSALRNAPHTADAIAAAEWNRPYSREEAAFPTAAQRLHKFWPVVSRIDAAFGDRNLVCICPPLSDYTD